MMATGLVVPQKPQQLNMGGVLSAKPLSTVLAEEAQIAADQARAEQPSRDTSVLTSSLASHIQRYWSMAKSAKQIPETEMLRAVRARKGEYDPDILAKIQEQGGSEIFMMVFATKARQMKALMTDILIGSGSDKPWTIRPTPKPELPPGAAEQIMETVFQETAQAEMMGMPMSPEDVRQRMMDAKTVAEQRIMEQARVEAERAEFALEDELVEGSYLDALDQFVDDLTTFKTAFLKGPVVRRVNDLSWVPQPDGSFSAQVTSKLKVSYERVDPFMIYPAPWAKNCHDAPLIERHKLSRSDLNALRGVEGYDEEAIKRVLDQHGEGGLREWLSIDTEKASAEGRDTSSINQSDLIDALQFWGSVSGSMLRDWGMTEEEVPDTAKEYEVEAWLIGGEVIKAVINPDPLNRRPYYADGFSRVPGAFWHNSLYDVVRDCQDMCNAAARAMANNLGISSGPQVAINVDRLPPGEDITEMYPWKIWQTTSDPMGSSAQPVTFFQPNSNVAELMGVYERFGAIADEVSGIPKYMAGMGDGAGGAGRTASGMSMMIGNASKMIKQLLASLDQYVISPMVERQYQHMMMYRPELGLKGDLKIVARGSLSLVAKEAAQVRLNEFLAATGNPVDMQIIGLDGRAELLRQAVKRLDINSDKVVPSATTVKMRAAQAQMQQMAAAMQGQAPGQEQAPEGQPTGNGQELMNGAPVTDNFQPAPAP